MNIISRENAKLLGLKFYFTNKPCGKGHICKRYVSNYNCFKCANYTGDLWYKNNKEQKYETSEIYRKNNLENYKKYSRNWNLKNSDERKKISKKYYTKNKEKILEKGRRYKKSNQEKHKEYSKKWREKNKEKCLEFSRAAGKKHSKTPQGQLRRICAKTARRLELGKIPVRKAKLLYYTSEEYNQHLLKDTEFNTLQESYKVGHHTDHIVPVWFVSDNIKDKILAFVIVMDLENLRLIKAEDNLKKSSRIDLPIVQETIVLLNSKYNVSMPLLLPRLANLHPDAIIKN